MKKEKESAGIAKFNNIVVALCGSAMLSFSSASLALTNEQIKFMKSKPVKQICEKATKIPMISESLPNWTYLSTKSGKWQGVNLVCSYESSPVGADITYNMMTERVVVSMRTEHVPSKREKECSKHFKAVEQSTGRCSR
ncbi:hypothetical protein [Aeromonas sanarellii]|uniref:hypothetical protein n=1 Tax=Aeromonas sanarellii TaxID=633415 RepID=UPI0038D0D06A